MRQFPMWPEGAGMFIYMAERKPAPDELRDALTGAVMRQDISAARALFDQAFWHRIPLKPDWFHLYVAIDRENRDMVKLLSTHGATWTEEQTRVAQHMLGKKCDPFKTLLRGAGIRLADDATDTQALPVQAALEMNQRILRENRKGGHDVSAEEKAFHRALHIEAANAVLKNDMPRALKALQLHPDAQNPAGHDMSDVFALLMEDRADADGKRALTLLDRLRAADVALQPVRLDLLADKISPHHYALLPALAARGLLQKDTTQLRRRLFDLWSYTQENIDIGGMILSAGQSAVAEKRAQFKQAAAVLCTPASPLDDDDVAYFLRRHNACLKPAPDAVPHMDQALLETGFFDNPAFRAAHLKALAETPGLPRTLTDAFHKIAAKKEMADRPIGHFLHKKRFAVLENAVALGVFVPDAAQTEAIVQYLRQCMKKETPSPEIIQSLKILKNAGADFAHVRLRDFLGVEKPGMAKALLDLDLIAARDINRVRLARRGRPDIGVLLGMRGDDDGRAMREFAAQVELERIDPAKYKVYRDRPGTDYQRLLLRHQLEKIKIHQRPAAQPRSGISPADLQRFLSEHQRRAAQEKRQQHERLRQLIQKARERELKAARESNERLRDFLAYERRLKEAKEEQQRKYIEQLLKRKRPGNPFGF